MTDVPNQDEFDDEEDEDPDEDELPKPGEY
jgi:hypothetical protein